jgi:outer membrane protein, adhesin transport system
MKKKNPMRFACECLVVVLSLCGSQNGFGGEGGGPKRRSGAMTLSQAIEKALSYDPTVRKIHADSVEATGFQTEMRADLMPQLSLRGSAGAANRDRSIDGVASGGDTLFSRSATLVGRQLLWSGGYYKFRFQDAKERLAAQALLEKAQRELTAFSVAEAYIDVVNARRQIALAEENVAAHRKVLDLAVEREKAGTTGDTDLTTARYDLARTVLRERQLALAETQARFTRYVGEKAPESISMPRVPQINSLADIDLTANWHYQAVQRQLQAAKFQKQALQKKYGPQLFLEVSGTVGQDVLGIEGRDNAFSAMVVLSWDLWDSGRRKGEVQQAAADILRQESISEETLVLLRQDAEARWQDYRTVGDRIKILRTYRDSLDKTVGTYAEQFDLGTRPLLSRLDVQNESTSARVRLADEERDHAYVGYRLLFFGGRLIQDTVGAQHLEPGPITPEAAEPWRPMGRTQKTPQPSEEPRPMGEPLGGSEWPSSPSVVQTQFPATRETPQFAAEKRGIMLRSKRQ